MATNNFRLTGTMYVAKTGNDSLAGTSPDIPKKNIPNSSQTNMIVGAGVYINQVLNIGGATTRMKADGKVIFDNLAVSSYHSIQEAFGFTFLNSSILFRSGFIPGFSNNFFKNCQIGFAVASATLTKNIFKDCINLGANNHTYSDSIFVNTSLLANITLFANNYIDFNSVINLTGGLAPTTARNNNVNGLLKLGAVDYAIQDLFVGTPQDNGYPVGVQWLTEANLTTNGYGGTIAGWNTAVATFINRDPKFNNVAEDDFTLQADSPHLRRAQNGIDNIGGTRLGIEVNNTIGTDVLSNIDTIGGSYFVATGETEGYIDYLVDYGEVRVIGKITPKIDLKFDSDFAGGTAQNNNVPDSEPSSSEYANITTTTGTGTTTTLIVPTSTISIGDYVRVNGQARLVTNVVGTTVTLASALIAVIGSGIDVTYGTEEEIAVLSPNRLTFQMRTSALANPDPNVDADWDNGLDPLFLKDGFFFTHEWFETPKYVTSGGSVWSQADINSPSGGTVFDVTGRWIQLRAYLRNNYSSKGL